MKLAPLTDRVIGIKVYYADGAPCALSTANLSEWGALPPFGVQVVSIFDCNTINVENDHGAQFFASHDYYWYEPGVGFGETNRPDEIPAGALVLRGSEMDKADFRNLYNAAMHDLQWPI